MITVRKFGQLSNGHDVHAAILDNGERQAIILSYGGRLHHFGRKDDINIVKALPDLASYEQDKHFHGALIGPVANRIKDARFTIDGTAYQLADNEVGACLHSGPDGFHNQIWDMEVEGEKLILKYTSPDGLGGFPGRLDVAVHIQLRNNALQIRFKAKTDAPTPVNMTWHPYFNLSGEDTINEHLFFQDRLGEKRADESFRRPGEGLRGVMQLQRGQRMLAIFTDYPEMQVYTGDNLPKSRSGIAVEPQYPPNDINEAQDSLLRPDETYSHVIVYRLSSMFNPVT